MTRTWTPPMSWENEGTQPSESLIESGFVGGYRPPAGVMNYFLHNGQVCIIELQEAVGEIENSKADINHSHPEFLEFDCGYFPGDEPADTLSEHVVFAYAHQNLNVDGDLNTVSTGDTTLVEHQANETAHQNLIVDGNTNSI
jgi:hypothetical protein